MPEVAANASSAHAILILVRIETSIFQKKH
jgi:hypothetical protein